MAVESDADREVFVDPDAFGQPVTVGGNSINAIFDNDYALVDLDGVTLESLSPVLHCRTIDVPSVAQGDAAIVNSVNYTVAEVRPDGTGMTLLRLRAT